MAKNPRAKNVGKWVGTNLCRLLLSATFLFSGMVKLIDPKGTQYKIEDYAVALGFPGLLPSMVAVMLAVALAAFEFCMGVLLLFAIRRRLTSRLVLLLFVVMQSSVMNTMAHSGLK